MFPVTVVDPEVDDPHPPHRFYNHEDEHIYKLCELFILFFFFFCSCGALHLGRTTFFFLG